MPGSSPRGTLVTRQADHAILRGITRTGRLDVIKAQGLTVEERGFTLDEAYAAREAFETSATQIVMPVVSIDGHRIGDGKPGPVATGAAAGVSPLRGGGPAKTRPSSGRLAFFPTWACNVLRRAL